MNHAKTEVNAILRICKESSEFQPFVLMGLELKAGILDNQGRYQQAYYIRKSAVNLTLETRDEKVYIACLHNLVISNIHLHNFEQAANYVLKYRENKLSTQSEKEDYIRTCSLQTSLLIEKYKIGFDIECMVQALGFQKTIAQQAEKLLGRDSYLTGEAS